MQRVARAKVRRHGRRPVLLLFFTPGASFAAERPSSATRLTGRWANLNVMANKQNAKAGFAGAHGSARLLAAAKNADWVQVVLNGGPPCFHLEDGRFCLRAKRWDGHKRIGGSEAIHKFVSLEKLLRSVAPNDQDEPRG